MSFSSAVPQCRPHLSELLSKLIATESMDTRLWLQGEMVRLVHQMIDSLFLRLLISPSARPGAQPFKQSQTNVRSTLSELCQLMEEEKETTNRLARGQMDGVVNLLFERLINKTLVNSEMSAFASVQPLPAVHQTVPSIAQSSTVTNNSKEHLSTNQMITFPPIISSFSTNGHNANIDKFDNVKQEYDDEGEHMSDCEDECEDSAKGICGENDDANWNAKTDTQVGLGKDDIEQDQQNASLESDLKVNPNVIDNSNQFADNATDLSLVNKSEQQIRSVRSKSTINATIKKNREKGQSAHPVIEHNNHHQSITSKSRLLRSSARKRISKNAVRDVQLGVNVRKSGKRKINKAIKSGVNVKRKQILNDEEHTDSDDQDDHATSAIGKEIATECTTNPIRPNLAQSNRYLHCSQCHKSFDRNSALQAHLRVHTGERPFPCDQCGKSFKHQNDLTKHQLIHQNIKSFKCDQCDKRFTQKVNLESHLRTHSGERPHQCRFCDKSFAQLQARNRHEQAIHLHVKPYRCKQCAHTATNRTHLITHIRMVHFGLPQTIKQQRILNIVDDRDPRELLEKV